MSEHEIERRVTVADASVEYREIDGEKKPVIMGYAAVFNSDSRNLGGFVESIHPNAFDDVLAEAPDVIGVFNHERNLLLGRTGNGSMRLYKDDYGLRYEITPNEKTSIGRDVIEWVKDRTVVGSSFAFAIRKTDGDSWSTDPQSGLRRREVRAVSVLEDVGPVVRPAYNSASVVVSRRAIEMAMGEEFRPTKGMANAAKRGLEKAVDADPRLACIAERLAAREIVSVEEVAYLAEVHERSLASKSEDWAGTAAWIEWQLAGGDSGSRWVARREGKNTQDPDLTPTAGMAAAAKRGLELHEAGRSGDGLKPETVARARRIADREPLTDDHVREMRAWFRRHKVDKRPGWSDKGQETPGYTAWMLWGGDAAWRWSETKVAQMQDRDMDEDYQTVTPRDMAVAESYEAVAEEYGQWSQSEAHYMPENAFVARGIKCGNCIFLHEEGGGCDLVAGEIDPNAVCKLWIIPQQKIDAPATRQIDWSGKAAELKATILRTDLHGK
jgi:hypothetical protein